MTDGTCGAAEDEFADFDLEQDVGLVAEPWQLTPHPRANTDVTVRALDLDGDAGLWQQVIELQEADNVAAAEPFPEAEHHAFCVNRQRDVQALLRSGGGWFVALDGEEVVGSLGVVVTGTRARYQVVGTRESHRRQGISSRLVVAAGQRVAATHPQLRSLVIVADANYHALGLYESLGFARVERVSGIWRRPPASDE